jgi:hypothetical protein
MSRHYTPEDQQFALERLETNHGDITRTAKELGIGITTLYRWRELGESGKIPGFSFSPFSPNLSQPALAADSKSLSVHGEGFREGLPSDDLQALLDLKAEMVRAAKYIAVNIIAAVEAAPLGQRVTALAQLIDRISKLAAQLPEPDDESWMEGFADEEPDEEEDEEEFDQSEITAAPFGSERHSEI